MLRTTELDYELPLERVAAHPVQPRDAARMMVVWRSEPGRVEHRTVRELVDYLGVGDVLVLNTTRVIPARFRGFRSDTRGRVEGLYLGPGPHGRTWRVLLKGRRMKPGVRVALLGRDGRPSPCSLRLSGRVAEAGDDSAWMAELDGSPAVESDVSLLDRVGVPPLPPYIRAARKRCREPDEAPEDRTEYQTVFADPARAGSVAAPTAGMHFTAELLGALADRGVRRADVTLHVGPGTFKPVETEFVEQHAMHGEWCTVPSEAAATVVGVARPGQRVVAVGTTSARTLETFAPEALREAARGDAPAERWTTVLISPGHTWRHVDALVTNFHLPCSTLMALVAALLPEGAPRLRTLYREAIERGYRFYSYGDAMLVLP